MPKVTALKRRSKSKVKVTRSKTLGTKIKGFVTNNAYYFYAY